MALRLGTYPSQPSRGCRYDPSIPQALHRDKRSLKASTCCGSCWRRTTISTVNPPALRGTKDLDAVNVAQLGCINGKVEKTKPILQPLKPTSQTTKPILRPTRVILRPIQLSLLLTSGNIAVIDSHLLLTRVRLRWGANIAANTANIQSTRINIAAINTQLADNNDSINELRGNVNLLNKDLRGGAARRLLNTLVLQPTKAGAIGGGGYRFYGGQSAVSWCVRCYHETAFKASVSVVVTTVWAPVRALTVINC